MTLDTDPSQTRLRYIGKQTDGESRLLPDGFCVAANGVRPLHLPGPAHTRVWEKYDKNPSPLERVGVRYWSPYQYAACNPVTRLDPSGYADYLLSESNEIVNDGIDDGLKYATNSTALTTYGPPSITDLKAASVLLPNESTWEKIVDDIYRNINPYNTHEDISAYGAQGNNYFYEYGGKSEDANNEGLPGQDGTKAARNATQNLAKDGDMQYSILIHSHPHPDAKMTGMNGREYSFKNDQGFHENDFRGVFNLGYDAGMLLNSRQVGFCNTLPGSAFYFDFGKINDFIKSK